MADNGSPNVGLSFKDIITRFNALQKTVVDKVKNLANSISKAQPGQFLLLQFTMSKLTQIGDSISNLIATYNSGIMASVRNQRAQ